MSVHAMNAVYQSGLDKSLKAIALAYADHADDDGENIFPSVHRMSWKTGYSERSVQLLTKQLVEMEILVRDGRGPKDTNRYRINLSGLPSRPPYKPPSGNQGGGEISAPLLDGGEIDDKKDDVGGEIDDNGGAAASPESSINHQYNKQPSNGAPKGKKPKVATTDATIPAAVDTPEFREKWNEWLAYRKEARIKTTPTTAVRQLKLLESWGVQSAVASIDQSILHGWQGLFPPKQDNHAGVNGNGNGRASDAVWSQVLEALRNSTPHLLDDRIKQAIYRVGGWDFIANMNDYNRDGRRRQFLEAYQLTHVTAQNGHNRVYATH